MPLAGDLTRLELPGWMNSLARTQLGEFLGSGVVLVSARGLAISGLTLMRFDDSLSIALELAENTL